MFQASHPGLTLTPARRSPTFALGGDGPDDLSTPLYPFRHTSGVEWNSNDMKAAESIFTSGYAYPEVPAGKTGDALRIFTTQKANQLYGPRVKTASFQAAAVSSASGSLQKSTFLAVFCLYHLSLTSHALLNSTNNPSRMECQRHRRQPRAARLSAYPDIYWKIR